jgi:hypothetical protein
MRKETEVDEESNSVEDIEVDEMREKQNRM